MCYGLPACTQTQRACPCCSSMKSVSSLQTAKRSCNKGMLSEIVYMLAGHSTPTINKQCCIPVNSIVPEHGVKFCENLPTAHVLTKCHSTSSSYRITTFVANAKTVGPGGKGQSILHNIRHKQMLKHVPSARLSAAWMK